VHGDITREDVDVIVNAANTSLRGGGGVDGAIHRAAGPGLLEECVRLYPDGCDVGTARITGGHRLKARFVIHTPGPVWEGGECGEPDLLAACYGHSVEIAAKHGARTIAFPAISCGVYGYPIEAAARVALRSVVTALARHETIWRARFVLFTPEIHATFEARRARLAADLRRDVATTPERARKS
jgi:O-acetyl-ADP-ribose deacetylase (regulator of RNase III)